jgi:hypothetical protein
MLLLGMTRGEIFLVVALFLLVYAAGFLKRGGDALERLFSAARGDDDGPASASAIASSGVAKEGGPLAAARPPGTAPGGEETASTHADAEREGARKKDPPSP